MTNEAPNSRTETSEPDTEGRRRHRRGSVEGASSVTARTEFSRELTMMEAVVERENMGSAMRRVEANQGSAGVDGMPGDGLRPYLRQHGPRIKEDLLAGCYQPRPVLKVEIPKPDGKGVRMLGIPTGVDRLIQQALHQGMQPVVDGDFSGSSYGFRPGRSAHQAVRSAQRHVAEGYRWVVDLDLEKFFDRVNHDILMSRVARKVEDKRVLGLIRCYLHSGMMDDGVVSPRREGVPQGGPLSPLLSNILLDDLDKELERRGHRFCRYADDCTIYVRSKRAGERAFSSITRFLDRRLRLKVNREKSAVDRPWNRAFLGYGTTFHQRPRLKVATKSVERLKAKLKTIFRQGRGRNVSRLIKEELTPLLRGWVNYFGLAQVKNTFEALDGWIRRKLRCLFWRQWKRT